MRDELVGRFNANLTPSSNGGEVLTLTVEYFSNGDPITKTEGLYANQKLELHSYGNSAAFHLCGSTITPTLLRKLADQMEQHEGQLRSKK